MQQQQLLRMWEAGPTVEREQWALRHCTQLTQAIGGQLPPHLNPHIWTGNIRALRVPPQKLCNIEV